MLESAHTFAAGPPEPTLTFADLERMARELSQKKPILKEVRVHPSALRVLRNWLGDLRSRQAFTVSDMDRVHTFGVYGTLIRIDKRLKRGQWKAVDTDGEVMSEGFLFPPRP